MGSQPSHTEKTMRRRMASQKAGVLEMRRHQPRMSLSGQRPRQAAATVPSSSPSAPERTQAAAMSHREFLSRSARTWVTGTR